MQAGDFLVELLGQRVHADLVGVLVLPEIDLRERLVGEAVRHHEAGMAGGATEVHQAAFGEQEDRIAAGEGVLVHLRLDVELLDALGAR